MEKPLCRSCGKRHWPKDGCQLDKPNVVEGRMKASDLLPRVPLDDLSRPITERPMTRIGPVIEGPNECRVCAVRRATKAAAMKKYRARNKGSK